MYGCASGCVCVCGVSVPRARLRAKSRRHRRTEREREIAYVIKFDHPQRRVVWCAATAVSARLSAEAGGDATTKQLRFVHSWRKEVPRNLVVIMFVKLLIKRLRAVSADE